MINATFVNFASIKESLLNPTMLETLDRIDWENAGGKKTKIALLGDHGLALKAEHHEIILPNRGSNQQSSSAINGSLTWSESYWKWIKI